MDPLNRLTRFDEWEVGASYRWSKRTLLGPAWVCVSLNPDTQSVWLQNEAGDQAEWLPNQWRHRFTKV